jgi:signal transduction histidine kinase
MSVSTIYPKGASGQGRLIVVSLLAAFLFFFFELPFAEDSQKTVREFHSASFLNQDTDKLPDLVAPGWEPVKLPDLWSRKGLNGHSGWYRVTVPMEHLPDQLFGIYIFRLNMNAAIYLNGQYVGDGGSMVEPLARNWNRPVYVTVPTGLWRAGDNELLIHLRTYPGFGMLAPPTIAPDTLLRPRFERRVFVQNDLTRALTAVLLVVSTFMLGLWYRRRSDRLYLWFAASGFCWAIFNTWLFVKYPLLPGARPFQWVAHVALDFWMVFLIGFMHRYLHIERPRFERLVFLLQAACALAFATLEIWTAYKFAVLGHTITLALALYVSYLAWSNWRKKRDSESFILLLTFVFMLLAGLHDWLMENPIPGLLSWDTLNAIWRNQFHLLYFAAPLLILALAWSLIQRFVEALDTSEQLNRELEARVEMAQRALEAVFQERHLREMGQAAADERERIYRNLHDDVGGKLLGLAISAQRANLPQEADMARSALQDLRDVVSRSTSPEVELQDVLADLRTETDYRLKLVGVALDWQMSDMGSARMVSAENALHLSRILRESVTNVLRHAQADSIIVSHWMEGASLVLTVSDNGIGMPEGIKSHRGMISMKTRAELLGGTINWFAVEPHGCRVELRATFAGPEIPPRTGG